MRAHPGPHSSLRPTGFVTWAAPAGAAREFRRSIVRNSNKLSPVRRKANAGPEGPALALRPTGLEPVTFGAGGQRSNPLSYGRVAARLPLRRPSSERVPRVMLAAELGCFLLPLESSALLRLRGSVLFGGEGGIRTRGGA